MKLELPDRKKLVHTLAMPIRWGDMDAMGHVNNTIYFRYMEILRLDWLTRIGVKLDPTTEGLVIINAFCTFHRQFEFPGDIVGRMYVSDPGRTSFETWVTMEPAGKPGEVYASGGATTVWVDFPKQKSLPIPDWLRAHLE
jgi:acyl-CoA thioester hydrolase